MTMVKEGWKLGSQRVEVQATAQGETRVVGLSTIFEDPTEETDDMEFTLGEPNIPKCGLKSRKYFDNCL